MLVRAVLAATLVALLATPAAVAHGGGAARGYASSVTALDTCDRSRSTSRCSTPTTGSSCVSTVRHTVLIRGYEGEPYLRFAPDGVFRNEASPATYLNDDRYGDVETALAETLGAMQELVTREGRWLGSRTATLWVSRRRSHRGEVAAYRTGTA